MTVKEIINLRLINQQIADTKYTKPEEIVSYLGAMQSQDWAMAKWAIGLRLPGVKDADVEKAFNEGKILRTHLLRPTWHFVTPPDIRWLLELTSHRVQAFNASYYRKQDLDQKTFKKCNAIMTKALRDHHYLTRNELKDLFTKAKINTDDLRLTLIMMNAELEELICSGPRKGKQFTYALLDEVTPIAKEISKEAALKKLTQQYFTTRGPATIYDFAWWSGLTLKDVRNGIELLGKEFSTETIEGKELIYIPLAVPDLKEKQTTFLIPDYDEYGISYKDRSIYHHPKSSKEQKGNNPFFVHAISVEGYFGGSWNRPTGKNKKDIQIQTLEHVSKKQLSEINKAVKKYEAFFS
ncbi:MAG: winged helix DNA-binding domain-containing protein [Saprospiraceae bacterium]